MKTTASWNRAPNKWLREALESLRFSRVANAIDVHVSNLHAPVMRIIVKPSPDDGNPTVESRQDSIDLAAAIQLALTRAGRPGRPKENPA